MFKVTQIESDGAFECARTELQSDCFGNIRLITCDAQKHIPRIERGIRKLNDRIISIRILIQLNKISKRFAIEMVKEVTKIVNSLPRKGGVHAV